MTPVDVQQAAATLSAAASALLLGLANGKYDSQIAVTENFLTDLGVLFPPALELEQALELLLWINKLTVPRSPVIPDGRGGYVPDTNSRVNPDGTLRPYDPAIDG